jgi:hypothetical protein
LVVCTRLWIRTDNLIEAVPIIPYNAVDRCHVRLPDMERPTIAILYNGAFYIYVMVCPDLRVSRRKVELLLKRGRTVVLTSVPKGFALWVLDKEAKPVKS